jgi:hypothetical protein
VKNHTTKCAQMPKCAESGPLTGRP